MMPWTPIAAPLRMVRRSLPEGAQLALRRVGAMLRQDDWAGPVAHLRAREQTRLDAIAAERRAQPGRTHVLIYSIQQVPPWLEVECSLAMALHLRGHDVRGVVCDGLLPICEMNLGGGERPPCGTCSRWLARYQEAFGLVFDQLQADLRPSDVDDADALLARTPDEALGGLMVDGVSVGQLARRELQRYTRGFVFTPEQEPTYRAWIVSTILLTRLAGRLLRRTAPDIVVAANGRTLPAASLMEVARMLGVRVVTWDTEPTHPDGLVFSHGRPAVEVPLDEAWAAHGDEPLTDEETTRLLAFTARWARSENTPFPYNPSPMNDRDAIRSQLGLRAGVPLVAAFTNTAWDMAAIDRDAGFGSMFDWLFALVDYAAGHPGIDLVVRAHPAETNVPADLRSRTPVAAEIRARYNPLPPNLAIVEGSSPISSYALADMAQVTTLYASRIGLEVALGGRRPWVAGDMAYRGKGFTRDLASRDEMFRLLDTLPHDDRLSPAEVERAERFANLWYFRYVTRLPLLRPPSGRFALDSFDALAPGGDPTIDRICDAITSGAPFLDLAAPPTSPPRA